MNSSATVGPKGSENEPLGARTTKYSDTAKLAMVNRVTEMMPITVPNLPFTTSSTPATSDASEKESPSPNPTISVNDHLIPPLSTASSLGRALQELRMTQEQCNGSSSMSNGTSSTTSTAPSSPRLRPVRQNSGSTTPRVRAPATTLNIPGMTRSKVSPDGKIANRDVGSKLVLIMVGLPARGKSYITQKTCRFLNWQQHETRIFNVGNRRRVAAGTGGTLSNPASPQTSPKKPVRTTSIAGMIDAPTQAAHILLNGVDPTDQQNELVRLPSAENMEQSAEFFDPKNERASQLREQVAMETLNELLDYLLIGNGSVGILDATNSTIERRSILFKAIKAREPKLGILFIESVCYDEKLLEANIHLKLSGPDYKDKDPVSSLADFKKRIKAYESAYVPLGKFEEDNNIQYIRMIDVGRLIIQHRLQGFLASGIQSFLSTFHLSPRQIWITRHGRSEDNLVNKIGGDSNLTDTGRDYSIALYNFIGLKRKEWEDDQATRLQQANSSIPGTCTPPHPDLRSDLDEKNFCVWTSMLKRSIQTAQEFAEDENFDVKAWEMLNELDAGNFEGLSYEKIAEEHPVEYAKRKADKLNYTYPGVGGEGYLQVIGRVRDLVREIERIKDHVLIIGHRSVCRVLMAYFMGLDREDVPNLYVPLNMLYSIEPKPYGMEFHAYQYDENTCEFNHLPDYNPRKQAVGHQD